MPLTMSLLLQKRRRLIKRQYKPVKKKEKNEETMKLII